MSPRTGARASVCLGALLSLLLLDRLAGSPVHSLGALVALWTAPTRRLDDGALTAVLAGTCWTAWVAMVLATTATVARPSRRQRRLAPSLTGSATMSAIPATVDGNPASRRPGRRDEAGIESHQPRSRTGPPSGDHPGANETPELPVGEPAHVAASPSLGQGRALPGPPLVGPAVTGPSTTAPASVGMPPPLSPSPNPVPLPATFRHLEEPEWSRALLGLAASVAPHGEMPLTWLLGPAGTAAFVDMAHDPPAPFVRHRSNVGWWLDRDSRLVERVSPSAVVRASTRAGLVTLWHDEQSRCLLDVVAARTVALDGPPVAVGYTVSDIVVELASRRWSDLDEVLLIGFGREMHGLENVRYLPSVEDGVALLTGVDRFGEGTARCLVIAPMPVDEQRRAALRRLLRLVEQTPFSGAICCDNAVQAHCTWHLAAHRQTVRLEVRGRAGLSAIVSPEGWAERTGSSLRVAYRPVAPTPDISLRPTHVETATVMARPAEDRYSDGVAVLVLGPVQIAGTAESLEGRPLLKELVAYLAFHPEGASGEACATVLWPERRVPPQTLSNRLHEARRALGTTIDGEPRLVRAGGRHLLSPDVRTDWARFVALTGPDSGPASWRQALMLVRGRPFGGLAKGDWTVLEGFSATIEAGIVDVAGRLGAHLLEAGDPVGAEWAIRRGLTLTPWDERLYRLLMMAADAAGNRGGVESALRSLAQVLGWSGDPIEIVHPDTASLYRKLTEIPQT